MSKFYVLLKMHLQTYTYICVKDFYEAHLYHSEKREKKIK